MRRSTCVIAAACAAMGGSALAHPGSRIWIGSSNNTLATFDGDNFTNPNVYTPKRVFIGGFDEDAFVITGQLDDFPFPGSPTKATEFPAYQVRLDGNAGF